MSAAFIACIYFLIATAVISIGLLDLYFSLQLSVGVVCITLAALALAGAAAAVHRYWIEMRDGGQ